MGRSGLSPLPSAPPLLPVDHADPRLPDRGPAAPEKASIPATSGDQFTHIQDRLRQMGATYYVLESWGAQEQQYRFYCKMAVGGNANYTRYFESIEASPLEAMTKVLQQVESWRSGR